jgi:hypothetical protein
MASLVRVRWKLPSHRSNRDRVTRITIANRERGPEKMEVQVRHQIIIMSNGQTKRLPFHGKSAGAPVAMD